MSFAQKKWLCHVQFLCNCTGFALVSGASAVGVSLLQDARSTPCSCIALARAKLVCFLNLCVEGADHSRPEYPLGHCRGYFVHLCKRWTRRVCVDTKRTTLRASVHTKTQLQYVLSRVLSTYFEAAVLEYLHKSLLVCTLKSVLACKSVAPVNRGMIAGAK